MYFWNKDSRHWFAPKISTIVDEYCHWLAKVVFCDSIPPNTREHTCHVRAHAHWETAGHFLSLHENNNRQIGGEKNGLKFVFRQISILCDVFATSFALQIFALLFTRPLLHCADFGRSWQGVYRCHHPEWRRAKQLFCEHCWQVR